MPKDSKSARQFDFRPVGRDLDIEVFRFADLRQRTTPAAIHAPHRYSFHMLVCVTEGQVTQHVDFLPVACRPGSFLVLRPGQLHSLGSDEGWEGWMVLFRSDFLPSEAQTKADLLPTLGPDRLPDHLSLAAPDFQAISEAIARMRLDATSDVPPADVHALLRYQLCVLLLRLSILNDQHASAETLQSRQLQRFARFRRLVEDRHATWHQVAAYADALGCTERSLTRAAMEATGQSAKSIISARIALEAKRFLAHTDRPIYLIAECLGFVEATNFAKFFKRETGFSPVGFRKGYKT